MIELKPTAYNDFNCPECNTARPEIKDIVCQGIHFLADCHCNNCRTDFYQVLPVGHAIDYGIAINKSNGRLNSEPINITWLTKPLLDSYQSVKKDEVEIEKKVFRECKNAVVLNTLDYLYGHVLLKLFNAQHHLERSDDGLVIILPKNMEWLIPKGTAEAWLVNLPLNKLNNWYAQLQQFVQKEFRRFDSIHLSNAYSHPDFTKIDIEKFTGIQPFDLSEFSVQKPKITFVLREDRWWYPNRASYGIYRIGRKLNTLKSFGKHLSQQQDQLVAKTIRQIKQALPDCEFYITGLGKPKKWNNGVYDLRTENMNTETEIEWCKTYAKSQLVIGMHGSNMLLPTAFAAGCVEILPKDRYGNIVQDIAVRYSDRRQLFLYRFCPQYSSPVDVAFTAVSIIRNYDNFNKSMNDRQYP